MNGYAGRHTYFCDIGSQFAVAELRLKGNRVQIPDSPAAVSFTTKAQCVICTPWHNSHCRVLPTGRRNGENESEDLPYRSLKRLSWSRAKDKVDAQCINQGMVCSLLIIEPFDESQAAFFVGKYIK